MGVCGLVFKCLLSYMLTGSLRASLNTFPAGGRCERVEESYIMKICVVAASLVLAQGVVNAGQVRVWGDREDSIRMAGETAKFRTGVGGEFKIEVLSGFAGKTDRVSDKIGLTAGGRTFQAFCVELDEFVWNPGNTYSFDKRLDDVARLGGANTNSGDRLSLETAYLYTQFRAGKLSGFNYASGASREQFADNLQHAFWTLEQEFSNNDNTQAKVLSRLANKGKGQAAAWASEAYAAVANGWGANGHNVRVLNIFVDHNRDGVMNGNDSFAQSQLTLIPLPGTAALSLAGMCVLGARRRRM
ncbi:MAG: hypothetical protein SFZ23_04845 [Planctomycetota bacterium]|nr:hypothetical protein [Planctomycetota bacterium]